MKATVVVTLLVSATAAASPRDFTHAYQYPTLPEGEGEVALWHGQTYFRGAESVEDQLQIGFGVHEQLELSLFAAFGENTDSAFGFHELRGEARFRIADRGQLPVDVGVLVSAGRAFGTSSFPLEARLELARDFGRLELVANGSFVNLRGSDVTGPHVETLWAGGATYELAPWCHLGAETWGQYTSEGTLGWAGPALGLVASPKLWFALSLGKGLTSTSEDFSGRLIVGFAR
jgi:hypothetical protein